jgi:hypothetical protein
MKTLLPIVATCLVSWGVVAVAGGPSREVFFGMLGPLVAVAATWLAAERAHRVNPAGVGSVLIAAFGLKMLFFGGYVVVAAKWFELEIMMFMTSFVTYFIALYVAQAFLVRRLTWSPAS